jgi:hypothetical protein
MKRLLSVAILMVLSSMPALQGQNPAAISACRNKNQNDSCSYTPRYTNVIVPGTCQPPALGVTGVVPSGELVCTPSTIK